MKIKTRLRLNAFISVGVVILIIITLLWSFLDMARANNNIELVNELQKVSFERMIIRDDYLLNREERAIVQWNANSRNLGKLLESASEVFTGSSEQAVLKQARLNFDATIRIFPQFMEAHKIDKSDSQKGFGFTEAEAGLISQVFMKSYTLRDCIDKLDAAAQLEKTSTRNRGVLIIILSIIGGILAIVLNSVSINRILAKRIAALGKGVEIIGAGNLDYRISVEGSDELTDLSMASNEMAARLKESYTSMESLQKEIDNRKRTEETLQATLEDLERSNRELEQFAYVASHDLQEPLRMVSSYTQLLAQKYEGMFDDKAKKFIDYAVDGAVRMQRLINDLLAYSRVNTQGVPPESVDSHSVLGEALRNLSSAIEETRAIIVNDDLPVVRADSGQLTQLFQNLIGNAIKFRSAELPLICVSCCDLGSEWCFSVKDNGIGIDKQYSEKVFVIFQRLHTRHEYPGTGIGLAICKRIVERHGGRIWFESWPGEGTTFFFTLPK